MAEAPRDLVDYVTQYRALPFESLQLGFRRRRVLAQVARHAPRRMLEVGCGERPLFLDVDTAQCVVVEPAAEFAATARELGAGRSGVRIVEAAVEDVGPDELGGPFDMVVVSSLLHEVADPQRLLGAVRALCLPGGVVHVNVPHARSLHRLLAVAMGLIPDPATASDTQRTMQQRTIYDPTSLAAELEQAGLEVHDQGSILVKPFTHAQMQRLVDDGFLTPELLDGLDQLAVALPELGSEIWVDAGPVRA